MLSSFPVLFVLLAIAALLGGALGFALNNRGDQWRRRFEQERDYYAQYRAETNRHNVRTLSRVVELEAIIVGLSGAPASPPAQIDPAETDTPAAAAEPTAPEPLADTTAPGVDLSSIDSAVSRALERRGPDVSLSALLQTVDTGSQSVALRRTRRPEPAPDEAPMPPATPIDDAGAAPVIPDEAAVAAPPPVAATALAPLVAAGDDLTRIRGIDADLSEDLRALGVVHFGDIESMSAIDELALEQRLRLPAGYITAEQWRLQAALLAADGTRSAATRVRPR